MGFLYLKTVRSGEKTSLGSWQGPADKRKRQSGRQASKDGSLKATEGGPGMHLALKQAPCIFWCREGKDSPTMLGTLGIHTVKNGGGRLPRYHKPILTQSGSNARCKQKG